MEVPMLLKLLQTNSIPAIDLIWLLLMALLVLVIMELYKKVKYTKK